MNARAGGKWVGPVRVQSAYGRQGGVQATGPFEYLIPAFHAHFDNANLTNTMFRATKIDRTTFAGTNLSNSRFLDMSITGNTLADADLKNVDFRRVDLRGASFGAAELDGSKFRYTCYDDTTTWPEGFTPPKPASCVMHTKRPRG